MPNPRSFFPVPDCAQLVEGWGTRVLLVSLDDIIIEVTPEGRPAAAAATLWPPSSTTAHAAGLNDLMRHRLSNLSTLFGLDGLEI